ncbi:hypothetical protein SAMD00020551_2456 [Mesobacillus selenatarsenatis SF-1]|uniref:Uncharacterized protein n=1 Tax=Mesobacillus selenatarsenatis (strain DSM 18680 / JCM 14380 / FERM P-15431 / SF-1) TaxID=1321606 RepID=A0A0A8X5K1_MESS1|nr:hypothetical protein SAMD00020551_2456 [Mesobacillus selenatarsenatis SF-1]
MGYALHALEEGDFFRKYVKKRESSQHNHGFGCFFAFLSETKKLIRKLHNNKASSTEEFRLFQIVLRIIKIMSELSTAMSHDDFCIKFTSH